jgi:predicted nucleic acid-binding Zn ribbon protein
MQQNKSRFSKKIISASEIGQYNYCSVAWFLQRCGYEPLSESLEVGSKAHVELGNILDYTRQRTEKSRILSYIGYGLLVVGIFFILFEVIL